MIIIGSVLRSPKPSRTPEDMFYRVWDRKNFLSY
eukprot:UN19082